MNTYNVTKLSEVPTQYQTQVKEEVSFALNEGLLVSVQLETFNDEPELYGVYCNTPEWVADYYSSGGTWAYSETFAFDC